MTINNPNLNAALVTSSGLVTTEWTNWYSQFSTPPSTVMSLVVSASPFIYITKEPGNIAVSGGTVSLIELIRGSISINVTGVKLIPVETKDMVRVTYSVLPTVQFLPRY